MANPTSILQPNGSASPMNHSHHLYPTTNVVASTCIFISSRMSKKRSSSLLSFGSAYDGSVSFTCPSSCLPVSFFAIPALLRRWILSSPSSLILLFPILENSQRKTKTNARGKKVPELRIYRLWDKPIGPHPIGMFEVNIFTPAQFGAFIPWLVINRGPLSALVHPNTGDDLRDHTQRATWMGQPFPLQVGMLRRLGEKKAAEAKEKDGK